MRNNDCVTHHRDGTEPWYVPPAVDVASVRAAAQGLADAAVTASARAHPTTRFEATTSYGPAAVQLPTEAVGSDALVVGSHGPAAFDGWRLGSVSHAVVRRAPCPVVVVPDLEPRPLHDRVVVGIDGSAASIEALVWACDEADDRGAEIIIVHAWDYPYTTELGSPAARDLTEVDAALELEAALRLAASSTRRPDRVFAHSWAPRLDTGGGGSRSRPGGRRLPRCGAVRSLLFGSVAHEVSARAPCPTVIVHGHPVDVGGRATGPTEEP